MITPSTRCVDPAYGRKEGGVEVRVEGAGGAPGGCCPEVRVSSSELGQVRRGAGRAVQEEQEGRMGVYTWHPATRPTMNSYPVYSGPHGSSLYLYDWGAGQGVNWFLGGQPGGRDRGVESPDLEEVEDRCPERVNPSRRPWRVYWRAGRREGWGRDEGLRVECWDRGRREACCARLGLTAEGEAW